MVAFTIAIHHKQHGLAAINDFYANAGADNGQVLSNETRGQTRPSFRRTRIITRPGTFYCSTVVFNELYFAYTYALHSLIYDDFHAVVLLKYLYYALYIKCAFMPRLTDVKPK